MQGDVPCMKLVADPPALRNGRTQACVRPGGAHTAGIDSPAFLEIYQYGGMVIA